MDPAVCTGLFTRLNSEKENNLKFKINFSPFFIPPRASVTSLGVEALSQIRASEFVVPRRNRLTLMLTGMI